MIEYAQIQEAADYILGKLKTKPEIGMVLGSGLGVLAEELENPISIPYEDIPHFPVSTVEGHHGRMVIGQLSGKHVLVMQGRFHYYEGYDLDQVVMPVRVMKLCGIDNLIVTNAAGGVNLNFVPGDLVVLKDHINIAGINPLRGANLKEFGPRFNDMSYAYNQDMIKLAHDKAVDLGFRMQEGVYAFMTGPSYETPAEIRMLRTIGVDVVGMSTVPEVITAVHCGMKILGISCITNMAAGVLNQPLDHSEVMETAGIVKNKFLNLVKEITKVWPL